MTQGERERRIEAAAAIAASEDEHDPTWSIPKPLRLAEKMLDAAEEAVPMVSEAEVQRRSRIDHEAAEREHARAERAEAAARDFAKVLREVENSPWRRWLRTTATRALNDHPSFSGEDGVET